MAIYYTIYGTMQETLNDYTRDPELVMNYYPSIFKFPLHVTTPIILLQMYFVYLLPTLIFKPTFPQRAKSSALCMQWVAVVEQSQVGA